MVVFWRIICRHDWGSPFKCLYVVCRFQIRLGAEQVTGLSHCWACTRVWYVGWLNQRPCSGPWTNPTKSPLFQLSKYHEISLDSLRNSQHFKAWALGHKELTRMNISIVLTCIFFCFPVGHIQTSTVAVMATMFENRRPAEYHHRYPNYYNHQGPLHGYPTTTSQVYEHTAEFQYSPRYRECDNASPRSIGSTGSSTSGYPSPSPRALDTPSPPTPASANKLYNLLKNPTTTTYNVEETWSDEPLDLKRKSDDSESPVDLSTHKRPRLNPSPSPSELEGRHLLNEYSYSSGYGQDYYSREYYPEVVACNGGGYGQQYEAGRSYYPQHQRATTTTTTSQPGLPPTDQYQYHRRHCNINTAPSATATPARSLPPSQGPSLLQSILEAGASGTTFTGDLSGAQGTNKDQPGSTIVCLAKKNLLPVTARVSDWLVKIIDFALSMPEFNCLTENDKTRLIYNSWTRLLLICMAETSFEFAVTPVMDSSKAAGSESPVAASDDTPTMKKVERIQQFVKKCQSLKFDAGEFETMKKIVLFSTGRSLNLVTWQPVMQKVFPCHDVINDDVITWKPFLYYRPFVRGIHLSLSQRTSDADLWCLICF